MSFARAFPSALEVGRELGLERMERRDMRGHISRWRAFGLDGARRLGWLGELGVEA